MAASTGSVADPKRWHVVWPVFINEAKTYAEGRRIGKAQCVSNPRVEEIAQICEYLKLPHAVERKAKYPRDATMVGRVRVRLFEDDAKKKPLNAEVPSKKAFLKFAGAMIPKLKSRVHASQAAAAGAGGGKTSNKKGKKKKKRK